MQKWLDTSNYIAVLAAPDEEALLHHHARATAMEIPTCLVREPDLDDAATALVIAPSGYWRRLSDLPSAGKEMAMA